MQEIFRPSIFNHPLKFQLLTDTMASTSNALILGNGEVDIYDPSSDIIQDCGSFKKAKVDNTDYPKSFYVVYGKQHYGTAEGMATPAALVPSDPSSGSSETINTSFTIESAQGFDVRDPSIVLFEHPNYTGNARQYRSTQRNITSSFPPNDGWRGVSSVIVTGGKWKLYAGKNLHEASGY